MTAELLRFLAMTVGPSITAAARPGLSFFAVQVVIAVLADQGVVAVPEQFAWLVTVPALVVAGVLAAVETAAKHDPDIAALARDLKIDQFFGAFGAFSAALLFASLGVPEAAAVEPETGSLLQGVAVAARTEAPTAVQVGAVGGAVALNLGLGWFRAELLDFVYSIEAGRLWARVETGGVIGLLILLPLLPIIVLALLLVLTVLTAVGALLARAAERALDHGNREACDGCDYRVRREASVCPECGTERVAAEPSGGLAQAWRAVRIGRQSEAV